MHPPSDPRTANPPSASGLGRLALAAGLVVAGACATSTIGAGSTAATGLSSVLYLLPTAGLAPALYLLASLGIGLSVVRWVAPGATHPLWLAAALGLGMMLMLSHAMGVAGLLHRWGALGTLAIGLALLAARLPLIVAASRSVRISVVWLAAWPAAGVLLAAACNPPGWLWASEFAGYDALSYHLQLPREWHAAGRIWPVDHNVYSYLPSFLEAAFVHLGAALGSPRDGFVTPEGTALIACQLLHAGVTLLAACMAGAAARAMAFRCELADHASLAGAIAGSLVLATPWSVVTGSLAYNEMGMLLFIAAALLAAMETDLRPWRRGLLVGVFIGAACGCKPTAILFGAPVAGLVLLRATPVRSWTPAVTICCVAGVVMLAPWLARNAAASGNPVFPQLSGLFGPGHWSAAQHDRYTAGHRFDGSVADALRLLVVPDPADPAATPDRPIHRGLAHPQWAFTGPLLAVAGAFGIALRSTRGWSLVLLAGVVTQLGAWALFTHVQSRFLLPVLVPAACLTGLAAAGGAARWSARRPVRIGVPALSAAIVLATSGMTVGVFAAQRTEFGGPNTLLLPGPAAFLVPSSDDPDSMAPAVFLRTQLPPGSRVLLIGDAAPLYMPEGTLYATTWDTSPAAEPLERWSGAPEIAAFELGSIATHVYLDAAELARLHASGWADPTLAIDAVAEMLTRGAEPVHAFNNRGQAVFRLPPPADPTEPTNETR